MNRRSFFGIVPGLALLSTWTTEEQFRSVYMFRDLEWIKINWLEIKKEMLIKIEYFPDENKEPDYCFAESDGHLNNNNIPCFVSRPMKFHDATVGFDLIHPRKSKHGRIMYMEMTFLNSCQNPIINHVEKRKI